MTLGQRIQELRKAAGLSQEGLGEALGVSRQAVSKWESDGGIPELDTLIAMSRLFGVTVGALLGVEEPPQAQEEAADPDPAPAGLDEERTEELLRRYSELTQPKKRLPWQTAVAVLVVAAALAAGISWVAGQFSALSRRLSGLDGRIDNVEDRVNDRLGSLSDRLEELLTEQSSLLSGFDWTVTDFDRAAGTVTLELSAVLKTYTPETRVSFQLDWTGGAGDTGTEETGWVTGPDFRARITLPMNCGTEMLLRVERDGTVQTQALEPIAGGLGEEAFELTPPTDLRRFFLVEIGNVVSAVPEGGPRGVSISSFWPELVWPTAVWAQALVNGETVYEAQLQPTHREGDVWEWGPEDFWRFTLAQGDTLEAVFTYTDNLGETYTQRGHWLAGPKGLESAPGVGVGYEREGSAPNHVRITHLDADYLEYSELAGQSFLYFASPRFLGAFFEHITTEGEARLEGGVVSVAFTRKDDDGGTVAGASIRFQVDLKTRTVSEVAAAPYEGKTIDLTDSEMLRIGVALGDLIRGARDYFNGTA